MRCHRSFYLFLNVKLSKFSGELTKVKIIFSVKETFMPHVISNECTMCGTCVDICPSDAISEGDGKFVIDPEECVDCAACVEECPVEAISET